MPVAANFKAKDVPLVSFTLNNKAKAALNSFLA
jgi:hypothetical protein